MMSVLQAQLKCPEMNLMTITSCAPRDSLLGALGCVINVIYMKMSMISHKCMVNIKEN